MTEPRRLRMQGGPFDGAELLHDVPSPRICAPHTNRQPADEATRARLVRADQRACCVYRRGGRVPLAGPVLYLHAPEEPGPIDVNCRMKGIAARHAVALLILEAQQAQRGLPGR